MTNNNESNDSTISNADENNTNTISNDSQNNTSTISNDSQNNASTISNDSQNNSNDDNNISSDSNVNESAKHNVLLSLRDINQNDKERSDEALANNSGTLGEATNYLDAHNDYKLRECPPNIQRRVERARNQRDQELAQDTSQLENLDASDPKSEVEETNLCTQMIDKRVNFTEYCTSLIRGILGDQGPTYNRIVVERDSLLDKHNELSDKHLKNVQDGLALDKELAESSARQGSLIDDFADLSTEMPDYPNED